jgi:hypothetical protein
VPSENAQGQNVEAVSSNIDDKTMHELYLWPFQDAVHAGTGNIMCSYNRVNNSYACANSKLLNGLLKTELGFQGFVVSDWNAQHAGVATALAGLDMAMPDSPFWAPNLTYAIQNGSVPMSRIDDMATRYVAHFLLFVRHPRFDVTYFYKFMSYFIRAQAMNPSTLKGQCIQSVIVGYWVQTDHLSLFVILPHICVSGANSIKELSLLGTRWIKTRGTPRGGLEWPRN